MAMDINPNIRSCQERCADVILEAYADSKRLHALRYIGISVYTRYGHTVWPEYSIGSQREPVKAAKLTVQSEF